VIIPRRNAAKSGWLKPLSRVARPEITINAIVDVLKEIARALDPAEMQESQKELGDS
jgi:hypothetical protein